GHGVGVRVGGGSADRAGLEVGDRIRARGRSRGDLWGRVGWAKYLEFRETNILPHGGIGAELDPGDLLYGKRYKEPRAVVGQRADRHARAVAERERSRLNVVVQIRSIVELHRNDAPRLGPGQSDPRPDELTQRRPLVSIIARRVTVDEPVDGLDPKLPRPRVLGGDGHA